DGVGGGPTNQPPPGAAGGTLQDQVFRDYPPQTIALSGVSYTSTDSQTGGTAVTAPFLPYGSRAVAPGAVFPAVSPSHPLNGIIAGSSAVYSFNPKARNPTATLRLDAWGFRQPFGLVVNPFRRGELFVTNNGIDTVGGSRVVNNDYDSLFRVRTGRKAQFFGWPDYFHDPRTGAV